MAHRFTRAELYDLVWSEPMKILAARFGISDVGLSKVCKRHNVPQPERGYWAKLAAGGEPPKRSLPPRGPGMSDEVIIGGDRWNRRLMSNEEVLEATPTPPIFNRDLEDVAHEVRIGVEPLTVPKVMRRPHRLIANLLENDEVRRRKMATEKYVPSWDQPIFDSPFEKRRLRLINAIFTALERRGMKPWLRGKEARELGVQINDESVSFTVDDANVKSGHQSTGYQRPRNPSGRMKVSIGWWGLPDGVRHEWEDDETGHVENAITEIVVELIVAGERRHRVAVQHSYDWIVARKAKLIEEACRKKEDAERQERERIARLEQERVERLLADAIALRQAEDIRTYVERVKQLALSASSASTPENLQAWEAWALAQADRIDPVVSGRFYSTMKDSVDSDR